MTYTKLFISVCLSFFISSFSFAQDLDDERLISNLEKSQKITYLGLLEEDIDLPKLNGAYKGYYDLGELIGKSQVFLFKKNDLAVLKMEMNLKKFKSYLPGIENEIPDNILIIAYTIKKGNTLVMHITMNEEYLGYVVAEKSETMPSPDFMMKNLPKDFGEYAKIYTELLLSK